MTSSTTSVEAPFDVTPQSEYSCSEHFDTIDRKILEVRKICVFVLFV